MEIFGKFRGITPMMGNTSDMGFKIWLCILLYLPKRMKDEFRTMYKFANDCDIELIEDELYCLCLGSIHVFVFKIASF